MALTPRQVWFSVEDDDAHEPDKEDIVSLLDDHSARIDEKAGAAELAVFQAQIDSEIAARVAGDAAASADAAEALELAQQAFDAQLSGFRLITETIVVMTTANVDLAGGGLANGTTHNGVVVSTGQFVFVNAQTDEAEQGLYVVPASGAASRASFADSAAELARISFLVQGGTVGLGSRWALSLAEEDITVGTTDLVFSPYGIEPSYAAEVASARGSYSAVGDRFDAIEALSYYINRDLAAGRSWSPGMIWAENPSQVGAWYDPSDLTTLFQDGAGTTPVTADADPVRYIADKSGNGNDLVILTDGTPGTFKETPDGRRYIDCDAAGISYKTTNNKLFKLDMYICTGMSLKDALVAANYFGFVWQDNEIFVFRAIAGGTQLRTWHRWNGETAAQPAVNTFVTPVNTPFVAESLAREAYCDLLVDRTSGNVDTAGTMVEADERTDVIYGINMYDRTTTASNARQHFFGGLILQGGIAATMGDELRDKIVSHFQFRTQRAF